MVAAAVATVPQAAEEEEEEEAGDEVVVADSHGNLALTNPAGISKKEIAKEVTNATSHTRKLGCKPCSNFLQYKNLQTCRKNCARRSLATSLQRCKRPWRQASTRYSNLSVSHLQIRVQSLSVCLSVKKDSQTFESPF